MKNFILSIFSPKKKIEVQKPNLKDLAVWMKQNRSLYGKGHGHSYWMSQAELAYHFFKSKDMLK